MALYVGVEVVGLKEALKELNRFDKSLRRQITRDYKQVVKPIERDAKAAIQQLGKEPLSGWSRAWNPANARKPRQWKVAGGKRRVKDAWTEVQREEQRQQAVASGGIFPWDTSAAQKMIKAKINTKATKHWAGSTVNLAVFTISWLGAADQVFALAGRESSGKTPQGKQMIRALNERHGQATRILWPAYEKNKAQVDKELLALVERVMAAVNKKTVFTQRGQVR
jgi:hypothetical protein